MRMLHWIVSHNFDSSSIITFTLWVIITCTWQNNLEADVDIHVHKTQLCSSFVELHAPRSWKGRKTTWLKCWKFVVEGFLTKKKLLKLKMWFDFMQNSYSMKLGQKLALNLVFLWITFQLCSCQSSVGDTTLPPGFLQAFVGQSPLEGSSAAKGKYLLTR